VPTGIDRQPGAPPPREPAGGATGRFGPRTTKTRSSDAGGDLSPGPGPRERRRGPGGVGSTLRTARAILLFTSAGSALTGCGGLPTPPPKRSAPAGPHQGVTLLLPHGSGVAEIVNEPEPSDRRAADTSVVVYFLMPDARTPLTPPPADVRVRVELGPKRSETLELKAEPRTDDPTGASRFASRTGPYLLSALRGELTATVGSARLKIPLSGLR